MELEQNVCTFVCLLANEYLYNKYIYVTEFSLRLAFIIGQ